MKKFIVVVLALALALSMAACQKEDGGMTTEKGKLKVGMDLQYPPFETFDNDNQPTGISVDVAQGLADELGLELEVVNMDFGSLITALETGRIDIVIASMSITEEREEKVDFTDPYFYFKIIGLMNKEYADKNGLTGESSADDLWAVSDTRFIGIAGQISVSIPKKYGFTVQESADKSAAITEITLGRADVLIISPEVVVDAHNANPDTTVIFWNALDISPIGMAVAEGNAELLEAANDYIAHLNKIDGVYDMLREKYLEVIQEKFGPDATMDFYINEN
ncbi:MAG: transporter substrate-binding domain-containing protein [Clostridia bacterium]|nr:transporter substrate-binding domain-containing protein [Clostridia bacterium]